MNHKPTVASVSAFVLAFVLTLTLGAILTACVPGQRPVLVPPPPPVDLVTACPTTTIGDTIVTFLAPAGVYHVKHYADATHPGYTDSDFVLPFGGVFTVLSSGGEKLGVFRWVLTTDNPVFVQAGFYGGTAIKGPCP